MRSDGYEGHLSGAVLAPRTGESLSGVRVRLDSANELWAALMAERALSYGYGGRMAPLPLTGSRPVVEAFLDHCRELGLRRAGAAASSRSDSAGRCRNLSQLQSIDGGPRINVVFVNRSGEFRHVDWIDRAGRLVPMGTMQPGGTLPISTWEGHNFMLADGPGNCIEVALPKAGERQIEVTVKSPGFGEE